MTAAVMIFVYLCVGYARAVRDIPRARQEAHAAWTVPANIRSAMRTQFVVMVFFWPIVYTCRAVVAIIDSAIGKEDPR